MTCASNETPAEPSQGVWGLAVSPRGPGAGIVKLDKMTGKTVWTSKELSSPAGYSSIAVASQENIALSKDKSAWRR